MVSNTQQDALTEKIIGCMIEVHRALGPGLLEAAYQDCLAHELELNGVACKTEHPVAIDDKGHRIDCDYRIDMMIEDRVILELKAVDSIRDIHRAQIMTYMKLAGIQVGLLVNFNVCKLVDGIQRFRI
jgi:GxxExxY protein